MGVWGERREGRRENVKRELWGLKSTAVFHSVLSSAVPQAQPFGSGFPHLQASTVDNFLQGRFQEKQRGVVTSRFGIDIELSGFIRGLQGLQGSHIGPAQQGIWTTAPGGRL